MTTLKALFRRTALATLALLAACGGGGGGASTSSPTGAAGVPSSGSYSWVLKASGSTGALQYGLSLVHPSQPGTEYLVEFGSSVVTDARPIYSGSVSGSTTSASALQPYALVYIVGGDVRRVPMIANGKSPGTQVQRAQSTTACNILFVADDYAQPENTRIVVSTAGADGQCGTADDGAAQVSLGGSAGLTFTALTATPLGYFRDSSSMAPAGWIYGSTAVYWGSTGDTTVATTTSTAFTSALVSTYRSSLVDNGTQLSAIDFPSGAAPVVTALDPTLTADSNGTGWVGIGFDADNYYVYNNSSTTVQGNWVVLAINRSTLAITNLGNGAGHLSVASVGNGVIFATIIGNGSNSLLAIAKTGGTTQTLTTTVQTSLLTVQTSASSLHELWRVDNVGSSTPTYTVEMIDESGNVQYTGAGGFPMTVADASSLNFQQGENRTRFIFATGYGSLAYSGAALVGFDAATGTATTLGTLPGASTYGSDYVFAGVEAGPASFMAGYAASSVNGDVQSTGSQVLSFEFGTASSLTETTSATQ